MADRSGADHNGHVNGHSKTASENGKDFDHLPMAPACDDSAELEQSVSIAEDRIAELFTAYDDALASGCQSEISFPLGDLDPDSIARFERLGAKARAMRRVQEALLATSVAESDLTHVDRATVKPARHDAFRPDDEATEPVEFPKTLGAF